VHSVVVGCLGLGLAVGFLLDLLDEDRLEVVHARRRVERFGGDQSTTAPAVCLLGTAELLEHRGTRREERGAPLEGAVGVEFGDVQLAQRTVGLAEVEAGARHRDGELDSHGGRQRRSVDGATRLECTVGAADTALAVHEQSDLVVLAGDAAVGAQLPQRQTVVARRVRGDGERLSHDGDAPCATGC
jgi:hypothetical protein